MGRRSEMGWKAQTTNFRRQDMDVVRRARKGSGDWHRVRMVNWGYSSELDVSVAVFDMSVE